MKDIDNYEMLLKSQERSESTIIKYIYEAKCFLNYLEYNPRLKTAQMRSEDCTVVKFSALTERLYYPSLKMM